MSSVPEPSAGGTHPGVLLAAAVALVELHETAQVRSAAGDLAAG